MMYLSIYLSIHLRACDTHSDYIKTATSQAGIDDFTYISLSTCIYIYITLYI